MNSNIMVLFFKLYLYFKFYLLSEHIFSQVDVFSSISLSPDNIKSSQIQYLLVPKMFTQLICFTTMSKWWCIYFVLLVDLYCDNYCPYLHENPYYSKYDMCSTVVIGIQYVRLPGIDSLLWHSILLSCCHH